MAFLERLRVVAFTPGPELPPEPGGHQLSGRGAAARVRAEEVGLQGGDCCGSEAGCLIHHGACVLPADGAGLQRIECRRQGRGQRVGFSQQGGCGAFADGERACDLCHLTSRGRPLASRGAPAPCLKPSVTKRGRLRIRPGNALPLTCDFD
ncbi:hypothetical protein NCCP2145_05760 [Pseudarthrobacter sp. NCCP-2145]|nr:hypothetical protein NCCP2145_05760 [Pseudarthrobacter sp. NCCP-2145]